MFILDSRITLGCAELTRTEPKKNGSAQLKGNDAYYVITWFLVYRRWWTVVTVIGIITLAVTVAGRMVDTPS